MISLERVAADPLHILDLVTIEKPLKALDFCYNGENDTINVLDSVSLAVMGASYAVDTSRGHQLLVIFTSLQLLPLFRNNITITFIRLLMSIIKDHTGSNSAGLFEALANELRS